MFVTLQREIYIYIEMKENDNTLLSISRAVTTIKTVILQPWLQN